MTITPRPNPPLLGRRVVVDAGHGGDDSGAVGRSGLQEKDVNLSVALQLRHRLRELGAQVRMTRTTDDSVAPPGVPVSRELQARVNVANSWPADVFLSVHCNSFPNPSKRGTESYHAREALPESRSLAGHLQRHMVEDLGLPDSGVRQADFYVLVHTSMPANLEEIAYLSNAADEALLADPRFQGEVARSLAAGVADWFSHQASTLPGATGAPSGRSIGSASMEPSSTSQR